MSKIWRVGFITVPRGDHDGLYDGEISMRLDEDVPYAQPFADSEAQQKLDRAFGKDKLQITKMWLEED